MQEDKSSKWLADQLRKRQEENRLPYELGAWEAFESKRAAIAKKKSPYWISGIAAAVTLLLVAGGLWLAQDTQSENPPLANQIALEEKPAENAVQEPDPIITETEISGPSESRALNSPESKETESRVLRDQVEPKSIDQTEPEALEEFVPKTLDQPALKSAGQSAPRPTEQPDLKSEVILPEPKRTENLAVLEVPAKEENAVKTSIAQTLIATNEKTEEEIVTAPDTQKAELAQAELPKEPQLSEAEIEEILDSKSFASLAMGVSPGFGASQSSEQATAGTSLGLGVMVDMAISRKLVMGSGLAVNYLNQASESQSYNSSGINAGGFSVTETNEINQVQLDIPLYFKYPITRNEKISVQAGFSNLITFNQGAEQESSYTRQVAVYDALAANSFRLQSESVSQTQDLSVSGQKFYPFATANLGVNIRLFDAKKTSYEVMPFYNYPLQEFSGYGEKLGMFGASFKVNFGAMKRK